MAGKIKYAFWFLWTIVELAFWPVRSLADAADLTESDSGREDSVKIFEIFSCFAGIIVLIILAIVKFWLLPELEWVMILLIQLFFGLLNKAFFESLLEHEIPYLFAGDSGSSSFIGDGSFEDFMAWPFLTLSLLKKNAKLEKLESYYSVALLFFLSWFNKIVFLVILVCFFLGFNAVFIGCSVFYIFAFSLVYSRINDDEDMIYEER